MNEGLYQANGDVLVFFHAHTVVPANRLAIVSSTLKDEKIKLAGFTSIMRGAFTPWFISLQNGIKTYFGALIYNPIRCVCYGFRLFFGDQVIFCKKKDFMKVGGFNQELPIMEYADLC